MHPNQRLSLVLALVVLPFALVSCGGDDGSGPETFSVEVTPATAQLATGSNTTLTARVTDGSGATVSGQSFTWSSSNEAIATVSATGTVEGLTPGQATITATTTINGAPQSATAVITVVQVATTVNVTPATGSIMVGATLQFAAEVLDGAGAPIPGATIAWSSSDAAVMSVDANGLATGVAEGMATISATVGAASGIASTEVTPVIGPLEPTEDITLSGTVDVTTVTIPVDVTVTADADLTLNASGTVDIAGTLAGNCVSVSIQAVGVVTLGGTVNIPCPAVAVPPGLFSILSGSGFTLQDAVITTAGDVSLVSDVSADPNPVFGVAASANVPFPCSINNTRIDLISGADGDDGRPDGEDGYDGGDITVTCGRDRAVLSGSTLRAGDGGAGGEGFSSDETKAAKGGDGGQGGGVFISSQVGISYTNRKSFIQAGSGGNGGPGESLSKNAVAVGGAGGHAGKILIEVAANGSEIFVEDLRFIDVTAGTGGMGGSASASGNTGADATTTEAAEDGGNASATGGAGGDNFPEENKAVLGDLIPRGLAAGLLAVDFHGGASGTGGMAFAQGGIGGVGNMLFPKSGAGGTMAASGGAGGKLMVSRNGNEGSYPGKPGNGGMAQFVEGLGGLGFDGCLEGDIMPGGNGGKGGDASGGDGAPGQGFDGSNKGSSNGVVVQGATGGGGDGGDGVMPGTHGVGGMDGIVSMGKRDQDGVPFEDGVDGDPCPLETASILFTGGVSFQGAIGIFSMSPSGSNVTMLTSSTFLKDFNASWSPDLRRIVFDRRNVGDGDIWVMDRDGTNQTNLINDPVIAPTHDDKEPQWSPDGSKILFSRARSRGDISFWIYVMNADGTNRMKLTPDTVTWADNDPAWSPNGQRIAFSSLGPIACPAPQCARDNQIFVMNADGSNRTPLTDAGFGHFGFLLQRWPAWAPDGSKIYFLTNRDPLPTVPVTYQREIYSINADGTDQRNLTNSPENEESFAVSPDGTKIAFVRSGDIFVMSVDGTNQVNITNSQEREGFLLWSPNSTEIAFYGGLGAADIFVVNSDGSNLRNITNNGGGGLPQDWKESN